MKRTITLPNGRAVALGEYVRSWKRLQQLPSSCQVAHWSHFPNTAGQILAEIRFGIHDRINRHLPGYRRTRKWDPDWQRITSYSARLLNTPRLVIDHLPPHLHPRFAHRLRQNLV